jgi:hypothetical protein
MCLQPLLIDPKEMLLWMHQNQLVVAIKIPEETINRSA